MGKSVLLLRSVVILILIFSGLFFLNAAFANYWAAGGPPNPHRDFNRTWADTFATIALLAFGFAFLVGWLPRRWKSLVVRRRVSQFALLVYAMVLIFQGKTALPWQYLSVGMILFVLAGTAVVSGPIAYRVIGSIGVALGLVTSFSAVLKVLDGQ